VRAEARMRPRTVVKMRMLMMGAKLRMGLSTKPKERRMYQCRWTLEMGSSSGKSENVMNLRYHIHANLLKFAQNIFNYLRYALYSYPPILYSQIISYKLALIEI
jgi:hypothetical protein